MQTIYCLSLGKQNPRLGDISGVAPPSNSDRQDDYDICRKSLLQTLTFHCYWEEPTPSNVWRFTAWVPCKTDGSPQSSGEMECNRMFVSLLFTSHHLISLFWIFLVHGYGSEVLTSKQLSDSNAMVTYPKKTWSLGLVSISPNRHTLPKVFEPSHDHAPSRYGVATSATSGTSGRLHCAWLVKHQCPMNPQPHATIMYYHVMFQNNWINSPLHARIFRLM